MKKSVAILFFSILSFGILAQQSDTIVMTSCNQNTPGWGESLGIISFYTTSEWIIEGSSITQIWSDAVTATNCQKTSFNGGYRDTTTESTNHNFNADCRSNPGFPGDLFSWCAVMRFADQLCPYPWRVPAVQDFIGLDIALGGTGESRLGTSSDIATPEFVLDNYITLWDGAFGGLSLPDGTLHSQGLSGTYWSQTEIHATGGLRLGFSTIGHVTPQNWSFKDRGFLLRCVR